MNELLEKSQRIESGLKKLITLHQNLKQENISLQIEIKQLKETIEKQQNEIRQLGNGKNAQQIAGVTMDFSSENPEQLRQKINEMIREVETCLSLLNQ